MTDKTPDQIGQITYLQALRNQRNAYADECVELVAALAKAQAERDEALALVEQLRAETRIDQTA